MTHHYMITGTHTGIGKTVVSSLLVAALDARYWKPVQSGLEEETDSEFVLRVSGCNPDDIYPERFRLKFPASPHLSAELENTTLNLDDFELPDFGERNWIVEGAGGVLVPFNRRLLQIDWFQKAGLPIIIVASTQLGTINHTLLTVESLRSRQIPIHSIILNGPENKDNRLTIEQFSGISVSGWIPVMNQSPDRQILLDIFNNHFDQTLFKS
ncbi:MAG: dethiobiotin synthase [Bacteroidetes bacterium]|nr:dethiobiotin synthase [Bacteroidota bacterium]